MNDFLLQVWTGIVWVINGFLTFVYVSADHILVIALAIAVTLFAAYTPKEQRAWAVGAGVLAVLTSSLAPTPVPLLLLAMSIVGWITQRLEQYNQPARRWSTIKAMVLYSLLGLVYEAALFFGLLDPARFSDPMTQQGVGYISTILVIAMFVFPIGAMAMAIQSTVALPPAPGGTPEELITKVRTRGKN